MPFLSDETKQAIREKCTIPGTPENVKLKTELEGFSGSYNQFLATIEAKFGRKIILKDFRGISVSESGHLGPDYRNLLKMIMQTSDPDYVEGMEAPGRTSPKEIKKAVKIPENW
jgi:hypothetical protein